MKDMSVKQERKDDRKNEGQKYIHIVGRLQNLGSFLNFQDRGGLATWIFPELGFFQIFQDKGGLGTCDFS